MQVLYSSLERVKVALEYREADRVPLDMGGSVVTGIHEQAYIELRQYLGLPLTRQEPVDPRQKLAEVDADFRDRLNVDVASVKPLLPAEALQFGQEKEYFTHVDEWGITWHMPVEDGLHYVMRKHPLAEIDTVAELEKYPFPDPQHPVRFKYMAAQAQYYFQEEKTAYILGRMSAGILEVALWLRGYENFYTDMIINKKFAEALLEKLTEIKLKYWEKALETVGENVLVVLECDDLADQNGLLISPAIYRELIKPRHTRIFNFIKKKARTKVYILYHTCGAVKELIPDLIESGIDALNPVQVSARGMDTRELKKLFGRDITFWGGGIDTQQVLPYGTEQEIRDEVKRRIDDLAPGGGFIFAAVHNIEAGVPPRNIMAMWEALQEYGRY